MIVNHSVVRALFVIISSSVIGCASIAQKKRFDAYNELIVSGSYLEAAKSELNRKSAKKADPSDLLVTLQAAAALRIAKQYTESTALFDEAETIIKQHNEKLMLGEIGSQVGAALVNDTMMDYVANEHDGVLINTYKALNFWQQGQPDLARIEFTRALERQRQAKIRFSKEIEIQKKQVEEKHKKNKSASLTRNLNNRELKNIIEKRYSNIEGFKAYPDFINPFTTYMAGLFFMSEGDGTRAADLLKETYGMVDKNATVQKDFLAAENLADGKHDGKKYTWVIFENGLGPTKEEFRIDLPIIILTNKVKYTGVALPELKSRALASTAIDIRSNGNKLTRTEVLASMDRVIQTEFDKKFPAILTRAIMSVAIKTAGQYFSEKELGPLGGWAVAAYQVASTSADIRMWNTLPKEFHLAKVLAPTDGVIHVNGDGQKQLDIPVPRDRNTIVYIKQVAKESKPEYDVIMM